MAEMTPARKRLALLFIAVGIALIVERTLASGADTDAVAVPTRAEPAGDAAPVPTPSMAPTRAASAATLHLELLAARQEAGAATGGASTPPIFAAQSWLPPAPPPAPVQAVDPQAPPFPYPYLGGLTDDAGRTAFFSRGDRVLAIRSGATVDGSFRVDHLDETSMTLTYLPLRKTFDVALGSRP
ncbi:MAG: hypothetical protein ABJD97_01785 [Betaproteobacteria bacterium]